jgi:pyruvate formate-lyase activating enzyme-like uncharacterized protein
LLIKNCSFVIKHTSLKTDTFYYAVFIISRMKKISKWYENRIVGKPTKGCHLCSLGAKLVLFVTGECHSNCFYCPIMKERRQDITFANEQQISSIDEAIKEAEMISAMGVGITGGDPAIIIERVTSYVSKFKEHFGKDFHCHLYTSHPLDIDQMNNLVSSGLDEIRFHPPRLVLTPKMKETLTNAISMNWDVGIEIPVIPDKEGEILEIINFAIDSNLGFVNLNEFEITEANVEILTKRNYSVRDSVSAAVKGSEELALKILQKFKKAAITIHYCSSRYKDNTQLRNRLLRRADKYSKHFDEITEDGLLVRARINVENSKSTTEVSKTLVSDYGLDLIDFEADKKNCTISLNWLVAKQISKELKSKCNNIILSIEIIHQYPYPGGIITYLEPL